MKFKNRFCFQTLFLFLTAVFLFSLLLGPQPRLWAKAYQSPSPKKSDKKICYWIAEKDGKESVLFGTMHILSGSYLKKLKKTIASSHVILVEINDFSNANSYFSQIILLPPDKSLKTVVSQDTYKKTIRFFKKDGLPKEFVNRCTSFYLGMIGQLLQMQDLLKFASLPMDLYILKLAEKHKIQHIGLETIEEQMSYFNNVSMEVQEAFLAESIDPKTKKEMTQLKKLYLKGDVKEIEKFLYQSINAQGTEELYQSLYIDRNKRMNEKILPYVEKGQAFIAVGFGHLVTETGMVNFLKKNGFQVTKKYLTW